MRRSAGTCFARPLPRSLRIRSGSGSREAPRRRSLSASSSADSSSPRLSSPRSPSGVPRRAPRAARSAPASDPSARRLAQRGYSSRWGSSASSFPGSWSPSCSCWRVPRGSARPSGVSLRWRDRGGAFDARGPRVSRSRGVRAGSPRGRLGLAFPPPLPRGLLAGPAVVCEPIGGFAALQRSVRLFGRVWPEVFALAMVAAGIDAGLQWIAFRLAPALGPVASALVDAAIGTLVLPVPLLITSVLYLHARSAADGVPVEELRQYMRRISAPG